MTICVTQDKNRRRLRAGANRGRRRIGVNNQRRILFRRAAVKFLFPEIVEIVAGRRAITADTDLRLCRFFGLSNGYWLRAQAACDTEVAEQALARTLAKINPWAETRQKTGSAA